MKAILMSIKPQHVANILNGLKTLEIRKKFPKDYVGWVYIYVAKGKPLFVCKDSKGIVVKLHDSKKDVLEQLCANSKVIARFWCDKVEEIKWDYESPAISKYVTHDLDEWELCNKSYLKGIEIIEYLGKENSGYAIHITNLEIFDKPKEISEFDAYCKKSGMECLHCKHYWTDDSAGYSIPKCFKHLTRASQNYCYIEI